MRTLLLGTHAAGEESWAGTWVWVSRGGGSGCCCCVLFVLSYSGILLVIVIAVMGMPLSLGAVSDTRVRANEGSEDTTKKVFQRLR
jgi:hypothetical protein